MNLIKHSICISLYVVFEDKEICFCVCKSLETNGIHLISHILSMLRKIYLHRVNIDEGRFTAKNNFAYLGIYNEIYYYCILFAVQLSRVQNVPRELCVRYTPCCLRFCNFLYFVLHLTFNLLKE